MHIYRTTLKKYQLTWGEEKNEMCSHTPAMVAYNLRKRKKTARGCMKKSCKPTLLGKKDKKLRRLGRDDNAGTWEGGSLGTNACHGGSQGVGKCLGR